MKISRPVHYNQSSSMRCCSSIFLRTICFLFLLGLSSFTISRLCLMTKQTEHAEILLSDKLLNKSFSEIETIAKLFLPLNSSASNLARALSSYLNGTELSFIPIKTKVAPTLFLEISTIPHLSHISYIGLDGLMFSFYNDGDQTVAVFSNTSFSSKWYTQSVNRDTGKLYGEATKVSINSSRFHGALNHRNAYSSLGTSWNRDQNLLFLNTVAMDGRGVISMGFPAKLVIDHYTNLDFHGADFHLASNDGQVLVQTKLPNTQIVVKNGTVTLQKEKKNGEFEDEGNNHSCISNDGERKKFDAQIMGRKHVLYCSILEIAGVKFVYILALPKKGMESLVHEKSNLVITLLVLVLFIVVVSLCIFIILVIKAVRREMFLCDALIKQMESTQQAERKSMNKSHAFSSASHDVRVSLAIIAGLIDNCRENVTPNSVLEANLGQMDSCTDHVLGILTHVLDTNKIEAGKMQLEEEEFNLVQLLEDVIDMYYQVGMVKKIDVVFDPCDGSILRSHQVKGDQGRLKQILCNLISNAVKFTTEGHVTVRAIVKKPSKENAIIGSHRIGKLRFLSKLCCKRNGSLGDLDNLQSVQQNPDVMEFVFEVDDTGSGIPKEKQKSVFENFVQIRETALGLGGCGLGLGIVQSLVRLMGGEIKIVDKEPGERGTCFRFNIFLTTCDRLSIDNEEQGRPPADFYQQFGLNRSPTKSEQSHVILLIEGEERKRISLKLIENLGIRVTDVDYEKLHNVLEKIKFKLDPCCLSYSERSELNMKDMTNSGPSEGTPGSKDGNDYIVPHSDSKTNSKNASDFYLIVVDANAGTYLELCSILANFRRDIQSSCCKIVWLDNPFKKKDEQGVQEERPLPPCDHILSKPFHGSRIYGVLGLLPEFGGKYQCDSPRLKSGEISVISLAHHKQPLEQIVIHRCDEQISEKMQSSEKKVSYENDEKGKGKMPLSGKEVSQESDEQQISERQQLSGKKVSRESEGQSSKMGPLSGKKVLLVEDNQLLRNITSTNLSAHGATVEVCENGKEAFDQVCKLLSEQRMEGHSKAIPYDYILMDCEMPVMDGYEATRKIRKEEKHYGVHIPIIALTAHATAEEASMTIQAGMDFHITKPFRKDKFLAFFQSIPA